MSSLGLKLLALLLMIVDHVGFLFFPSQLWLRAIGRLSMPLFAYQMAVGFSHTHNKEKHILSLFLFALLCQIPYQAMLAVYHSDFSANIIVTFCLALLILQAWETWQSYRKQEPKGSLSSISILFPLLVTALCLGLGIWLPVDYSWYGILLTILFYVTLSHRVIGMLLFSLLVLLHGIIEPSTMSLLGFVSLLDIPILVAFNGKRGYRKSWPFYVAYVAHFVVLLTIHYGLSLAS